jgi:predicted dehydrogenase
MASRNSQSTRRGFLKQSATIGAGFWVAGGLASNARAQANSRLQIAKIGIKGKGDTDMTYARRFGEIYAICDIDRRFLEPASKVLKLEQDRVFTDYRELLDKLGDTIDVVVISTPDHTHAVMAGKAMRMKKHVYVQKPLTHSIWEARELGNIARETGVVTQMGNQFTALPAMRQAAARVKNGQVGTVKEVWCWTDRPIWDQGIPRPASKPAPKEVDWDSWIGPAPMRDYADGYHQFSWRGWWDFGTGSLGDMACHTMNLPFMALDMRDPVSAEAVTSPNNKDSYPDRSRITYQIPERNGRPAFTLHWADKSQHPPEELYAEFLAGKKDDRGNPKKLSASGCLIVGDKCTMYAAGDYAQDGIELSGGTPWIEADYVHPPRESGDTETSHVAEFYDAIMDMSRKTMSNIPDYAGPLVEMLLVGNLAAWKGGKVTWDAKTLTADDPSLASIVKPTYRAGYEV